MPVRDFRNTMGFLDLMARENYQAKRQANDDLIAQERRQAEYGGMQQLLKGVGAEQERIRAGEVKKAGAQGIGSALDNGGAPRETGDTELDASGLEGYNKTRLGLETSKRAQEAALAKLLAGKQFDQPYKDLRADQMQQRIDNLERQRDWAHGEKDQDQEMAERGRLEQNLRFLAGEQPYSGQVRDPAALDALNGLLSRYGYTRGQPGGRPGGVPAPADSGGAPDAPTGSPSASAPSASAAPPAFVYDDDNSYNLSKPERKQVSEDFRGVQKARQANTRMRKAIDSVPEERYGRLQGGAGDKFGILGNWGMNDLRTTVDSILGEGNMADHHAFVQGQVDEAINDINRYMNSARATDRDRENITKALGMVNTKNIFSTKRPTWHRILAMRDKLLENDEHILGDENTSGRRKKERPAPDTEYLTSGWGDIPEEAAPAQAAPAPAAPQSPPAAAQRRGEQAQNAPSPPADGGVNLRSLPPEKQAEVKDVARSIKARYKNMTVQQAMQWAVQHVLQQDKL